MVQEDLIPSSAFVSYICSFVLLLLNFHRALFVLQGMSRVTNAIREHSDASKVERKLAYKWLLEGGID